MPDPLNLAQSALVAFLPVRDPEAVRAFYESALGLRLVADELPFALVFSAHGTMLRITTVPGHTPVPYAILGWQVESIEEAVAALSASGVQFLRYPGMNNTHPLGIWNAPSGARVAWFQDPEKNMLSLTEFPGHAST
jgi:catechol 2,3-dioxygenase-like lactoylglutathione lyase family enzyme